MKCLHFSVPSTSAIHQAIAQVPGATPPQPVMGSPDHFNCHRLLTVIARCLDDPGSPQEVRAESVHAADVIIDELAHDRRVQEDHPGEYFGIRFLQAEARSAFDEYQAAGDTSGFDRFKAKLNRSLFPRNLRSDRPRAFSAPTESRLHVAYESRSLASEAGRLAMFLVLLFAAIAGVVCTGMFVIGVGF